MYDEKESTAKTRMPRPLPENETADSIIGVEKESAVSDPEIPYSSECPFCCGEISEWAVKCKFCGEWLDGETPRTDGGCLKKGSREARSVSRGIKEKEFDDLLRGLWSLAAITLAGVIWWYSNWIWALMFFVGMTIVSFIWYYRE